MAVPKLIDALRLLRDIDERSCDLIYLARETMLPGTKKFWSKGIQPFPDADDPDLEKVIMAGEFLADARTLAMVCWGIDVAGRIDAAYSADGPLPACLPVLKPGTPIHAALEAWKQARDRCDATDGAAVPVPSVRQTTQ